MFLNKYMNEGNYQTKNSRELLHLAHLMPGLKDDGTLDEKELTEWVEKARSKCAETNHVTEGDLGIAFMLAHTPGDSDGA